MIINKAVFLFLGFSALVSAEGFEEVRGRCAEGTERAGVPRP